MVSRAQCQAKIFKSSRDWYSGLFKPFGPATFMPVERIKEICIACDISINGEEVIAVNPMQKGVPVNKPYKSLLASYLVILS